MKGAALYIGSRCLHSCFCITNVIHVASTIVYVYWFRMFVVLVIYYYSSVMLHYLLLPTHKQSISIPYYGKSK